MSSEHEAFFKESLEQAERHLAPKLQASPWLFSALKGEVRILCPGGGILPGLPVLLSVIANNPTVTKVNVLSVDLGDDLKDVFSFYKQFRVGSDFSKVSFKKAGQSASVEKKHDFSLPQPHSIRAKSIQQRPNLVIAFEQSSILSYVENFNAAPYDIIFYENPLVDYSIALPEILGLMSTGGRDYRASFAYLSKLIKPTGHVVATTYTLPELYKLNNLLQFGLRAKADLFPAFGTLSYRGFSAGMPYQNALVTRPAQTLQGVDVKQCAATIVNSDYCGVPFVMIAFSLFYASSSSMHESLLVTGLFVLSLSQLFLHRVGVQGVMMKSALLLLEVSIFCAQDTMFYGEASSEPGIVPAEADRGPADLDPTAPTYSF